ncbi:MAG: hypothetical protein ACK56I_13245, partial [bacterium]
IHLAPIEEQSEDAHTGDHEKASTPHAPSSHDLRTEGEPSGQCQGERRERVGEEDRTEHGDPDRPDDGERQRSRPAEGEACEPCYPKQRGKRPEAQVPKKEPPEGDPRRPKKRTLRHPGP